MKLKTLQDLYVAELRDLYHAEGQLLKALPKMAKAAASDDLRAAFEEHAEQTKGHVERLEQIFTWLDMPARGKKCKAVEGMVEEGKEMIHDSEDDAVLDAALIAAAQKVEHYEIAGYGTARTYARMLGQEEAADLLQETLDEEGETDKRLTELAEGSINAEAAAAPA